MTSALEDVALLANSESRFAVLRTFVAAPRARGEIRERVDASRVTIARALDDLEERNWIERSGRTYEATATGKWVCEEFTRLVEELQAERRLREPVQWLPTELVTFDARCLRDAEVILVDENDLTALHRRILEFQRSGDHLRDIAREDAPEFIEAQQELSVQGDTRVDLVITPEILEAIREHPPSARNSRDLLENENARYAVHEDVPMSIGIVDGSVGLNLADEQQVPRGGPKGDDETVHAWAMDLFETYREEARPVEPDAVAV